jgi:hypothetical protein
MKKEKTKGGLYVALINGRVRYLKFNISFSILPLQVEGKEIPCKLPLGLKGGIAPFSSSG